MGRSRLAIISLAAIVIVVGIVYALTLCPTISVSDSGEMATAAARLEIAHPPGYPLLTVVGHFWTDVAAWLRPILALNILSALFALGACLAIFGAIVSIHESKGDLQIIVAATMATLFGLGRTIWASATSFEAYSLSAMLMALCLFAVVKYRSRGELRWLMLAVYTLGLSLGNHFSAIALAPAVIMAVFAGRSSLKLRSLALLMTLIVVSGSIFAYSAIRSRFDVVLDWYNPQTLDGFSDLVTAKNYRVYVFEPTIADLKPYAATLWSTFGLEYGIPISILAVIGLVLLWRRNRWLAEATGAILLTNVVLTFPYVIFDIAPYFIPSMIILLIWIAEIPLWLAGRSAISRKVGVALAVALVVTAVAFNYSRSNQNESKLAERFGKALLDAVPNGGTVVCGSIYTMFPALYLHNVEGYRSDCKVYGPSATDSRLASDLRVGSPSAVPQIERLLPELAAKGPVYFSREPMQLNTDVGLMAGLSGTGGLFNSTDPAAAAAWPQSIQWPPTSKPKDPKEAGLYATLGIFESERLSPTDSVRSNMILDEVVAAVTDLNNSSLAGSLSAYLISAGKLPQAELAVRKALGNSDVRLADRKKLLFSLGQVQLMQDFGREAESTFEALSALDKENPEVQYALLVSKAIAADNDGNPAKAIEALQQALSLKSGATELYWEMAIQYLRIADTTSAVQWFNQCVANGVMAPESEDMLRIIHDMQN